VDESARYINEVALFEDERVEVAAEFAVLIAHGIVLAGKYATLLFNLPVFGSHCLKYENVVIVPVRLEAFSARWRQIEVGLKPMAQLGGQRPAEQAQLRLPMMQLIEDERAAGPHVAENGLQTLRHHAFVRRVLVGRGIGNLDVVRVAGDGFFETSVKRPS
jgi:UDP-N-acetylmuramyl pentapeptide synthase